MPVHDVLMFAAACLVMVLTPGPNMIYLISRSICQGRKAGITSLVGVVAGFFVHMFAAAAGLTATDVVMVDGGGNDLADLTGAYLGATTPAGVGNFLAAIGTMLPQATIGAIHCRHLPLH